MSEMFVRTGGKVFGPYSPQQLAALVASGRVTPQTEVSSDRVNWVPAAALQSAAGPTTAAREAGPHRGGTSGYLAALRGRTNYPVYRAVVTIFAILGFVGAGIPTVAHVVMIVRLGLDKYFQSVAGQEWLVVMPFFVSALAAVGVKFYQEFATMIVDFADSTIDHHSRS